MNGMIIDTIRIQDFLESGGDLRIRRGKKVYNIRGVDASSYAEAFLYLTSNVRWLSIRLTKREMASLASLCEGETHA